MSKTTLSMLLRRPIDGHKGSFGTVGVIGGSVGSLRPDDPISAQMIGAPALVGMGANRAGCGLVKIASAEPIISSVLTLAPMATGYPIASTLSGLLEQSHTRAITDRLIEECDALVVGPGMGTRDDTQYVAEYLIRNILNTCTLILDADAINCLSAVRDLQRCPFSHPARVVLTPHPGEARRLMGALGLDGRPDGSQDERIDACRALASSTGAIVVLKGHGTIVSDGTRCWVCDAGHPCLATGGTGDVLAGMIASVAAQIRASESSEIELYDGVCIAVEAHALCGEQWAEEWEADAGLDPRDLGLLIPSLMDRYRL
ncbi:MAG: NAD(P)H-hydrate dehydratase [Phycisphaerales bacterium]|nr:NAD(P)H-hydrate dehydratase [Phycisphaerales bacterium]